MFEKVWWFKKLMQWIKNHTVNTVIRFAFRGGNKDERCVFSNTVYWIKSNIKMNGDHYSLTSLEQPLKYLFQDCIFKVGFQIIRQVIDVLMGSDLVPFFFNLLFSLWIWMARYGIFIQNGKFGHIYIHPYTYTYIRVWGMACSSC